MLRGSLPRFVFALIGMVFILGGVSLSELQLARDLLINCGVAVATIALIDYIWGVLGGEPLSAEIARLASLNDLLKDSAEAGLVRVHPKIERAPNPGWEQLIESCKHSIDLCGYQLLDLVHSQAILDALMAKAKTGLEIRILLYNPDNSTALDVAASHIYLASMKENMRLALTQLSQANGSLPAEQQFQIASVAQNEVMDATIRRFDDLMYVAHYLHSVNTPETPLFVIRREKTPDCLFNTYLHWFDGLMQRGNRLKDNKDDTSAISADTNQDNQAAPDA